jgi:hypothetical protein
MEITNRALIDDLLKRTNASTEKVKNFERLTIDELRYKKGDEWNILQCLEHLNLYGDFYLVEIEKQIMSHQHLRGSTIFRSGLIGNYFANLMEVKDGKIRKMRAPKDKNPKDSNLTVTTIRRFLKQQEQLVFLLNKCIDIDLAKVKTSLSLTRLVKLRLGDTLRFYTYHIERHIWQAERIWKEQKLNAPAVHYHN